MGKHSNIDEGPPGAAATLVVDNFILELIATELDAIRGALEDVAALFCSDVRIVQTHGELLQSIDELAQRHENIARVLRADPMELALDTITLESLKNRMLDGVTNRLAEAAGRGGQTIWTGF